ncbi:unnamed protein product, partial [Brenthis ino]
MVKVAVLGAGVNGLSCAVKIKEKYPYIDVVLISNDFTPNTISDGCGGLWYPYICGDTPQELLCKWGGETYKFMHKLWLEGGHDITFMPLYELYRRKVDLPIEDWASVVFGYRIFGEKQLEYFSDIYSKKYICGRGFITFIAYSPTILSLLHKRFKNAGGVIIRSTIGSLNDTKLDDYDIIINCLGLGARDVVPDKKVFPVRGQISRISAPWINEILFDDYHGNYILPNVHNCVLGGTHQENDYNLEIDDKDTDIVINGCKDIMPGIKNAIIITHWVGLRPGRDEVRLEPEEKDGKLYIHNYGHGGSGFTLFWGCASNVLEIFEKHMNGIGKIEKSKL